MPACDYSFVSLAVTGPSGRTTQKVVPTFRGSIICRKNHPVVLEFERSSHASTARKLKARVWHLGPWTVNKDGSIPKKGMNAIEAHLEANGASLASDEAQKELAARQAARAEWAILADELAEEATPVVKDDSEELVALRAEIARLGATIEAQGNELDAFRQAEAERQAQAEREALIRSITEPLMAEIEALKEALSAKVETIPVEVEVVEEEVMVG